ncbi:MAG: protein kinase, partial [Promicromonosporaceae bacterium]|nr:protein kinase [Promicromonosporaceae bacterium]
MDPAQRNVRATGYHVDMSAAPAPNPVAWSSGGRFFAPGTYVGGYSIAEPLGAGAMGAVYRAHDDGGQEVALKILHPDQDADPAARELMAQELQALKRLKHPNIARVLDAELDASLAFLVTELIPGPTLEAEVNQGGPLDAIDLYELADQLGSALLAVETAGVVHRDIKPGNVVVGEQGPVLIDFGIATELGPDANEGPIMGTPGYLAPEILDGAAPSAMTDWWSWAAVLAFAGTGHPPFGFGARDDVLSRERQGRADLVGLPTRTATALLGALQPDPRARTSPVDVMHAIRRDADEARALYGEPLPDYGVGIPTEVLPEVAAPVVVGVVNAGPESPARPTGSAGAPARTSVLGGKERAPLSGVASGTTMADGAPHMVSRTPQPPAASGGAQPVVLAETPTQVIPPAATQVISTVATQVVSPAANQVIPAMATQVIPTAATQIISPAATQVISPAAPGVSLGGTQVIPQVPGGAAMLPQPYAAQGAVAGGVPLAQTQQMGAMGVPVMAGTGQVSAPVNAVGQYAQP